MSNKFTSSIAGATIFIAIISLLSRGIGFLREIIFAGYFGTREDFDLYLVGAALPVTISTSIYFIGQNFFIPTLNKFRITNDKNFSEFISNSFILFIVSGVCITIILYLAAGPIIDMFIDKNAGLQRVTALKVFKIIIFTVPFSAGVAVLSAYLHSVYEFKYPTLSILILNLTTVLIVLLIAEHIGVLVIAIGYLIGSVLQFLYLLIKSKLTFNVKSIVSGFRNDSNAGLSILNLSFVSIILIEIISQLFILFDRYFYSEVSSGGIAALNYGQSLFLLPVSILSMALATAIFPKLTGALNENNTEAVRLIFFEASRVILLIIMPISFIFIFYPEEIVSVIFERGNFTTVSTSYTADVLRYFSLSLVFYAVYSVINKIFYSAGFIKTLLAITVLASSIKFVLNYLLVEGMGQNGLAAASAITYFFFFLSCFLILNARLKLKVVVKFISEFIWMLMNSLIALYIAYILTKAFDLEILLRDILFVVFFILFYVVNVILVNRTVLNVFWNFYNRVFSERLKIFT